MALCESSPNEIYLITGLERGRKKFHSHPQYYQDFNVALQEYKVYAATNPHSSKIFGVIPFKKKKLFGVIILD